MSVVKCGGVFHLRRGVRVSFKSVDGRTSVYVSLKTDSEMMASLSRLSKVQASPEVGSGQRF
jgi:hypothetical protein